MSTIKLTFNSKNTSNYRKDAKKLARKLNAYKSDRGRSFLTVETEKANIDKDFRSLFNHVINIEETTLELDNEIVKDIFQFRHVINCRYLNTDTHCYGICRMVSPELGREFVSIGMFDHEGGHGTYHPGEVINNADNIAVKKEENSDEELLIDKHKLYERFLDDTKLQREICKKYNLELVNKKFSELPGLAPRTFKEKNVEDSEAEEDNYVKKIEEEHEENNNNINEDFISKIGDEFEKRIRKVLDEYFKKEK